MPISQEHWLIQVGRLVQSGNAFDLSWSESSSGTESRALCGWYRDQAPVAQVAELALQWGLPPAVIQRWAAEAADSDVGITLNSDISSFRLYTHRWGTVSPDQIGAVVYRGFKGLPDQTCRVDEYQYTGDLRDSDNLEFALARTRHPARVLAAVERAAPDVPLVFSRITNAARQSWLATVRHAQLDAQLVSPELAGYKLAHLAGGIDASKGEFDTSYVSSSPDGFLALITPD